MSQFPSKLMQKTVADQYGRTRHVYQTPDGETYPSVTDILSVIGKPALIGWAAKMERELVLNSAADLWEDVPVSPKKMTRAAYLATLTQRIGKTKAHQRELARATEIGSQIHALIEWNLRKELNQTVGPEPHILDPALWSFMVYEEWRKQVAFTPLFIEQVVWSREYGYAGTMDVLAQAVLPEMPDGAAPVVCDWKSGKAIYPEALLQNAAYVHALIEMGHVDPPVHGVIVRLPKVESDPEPDMCIVPWAQHGVLFDTFLAVKKLWEWLRLQEAAKEIVTGAPSHVKPGAGEVAEHPDRIYERQREAAVLEQQPLRIQTAEDAPDLTLPLEQSVAKVRATKAMPPTLDAERKARLAKVVALEVALGLTKPEEVTEVRAAGGIIDPLSASLDTLTVYHETLQAQHAKISGGQKIGNSRRRFVREALPVAGDEGGS